MSAQVTAVRTYVAVFLVLITLTALTTFVAFLDLRFANVVVALLIAGIKATLVVLFFMHVRYNTRVVPLVIVAAFFFLGILFSLTFADYFTRGWYGVPGK